ncbi:carboxypeptidase-like regulatory domain-containing protein [Pedobacter steynii]
MNKTFTKAIFTFLLLSMSVLVAQAQNVIISGTVSDKATKEPIPGVGITVKGTTIATATNTNGKYTLTVKQAAPFTIVISYVGYASIEKEVTGIPQI